jgi:hypothetical protein
VIPADEYCRAIEAHLCRKNDGHLIRIVGPAFERVVSWAEQGIPLKVALSGVDRYFERYYRKGPRRRPVRIEFCEADVLDAFDEWRRAVGVSVVAIDEDGGAAVEEPVPAASSRPRRSLRTHIEAVLARLTVLRGSDRLGAIADGALADALRAIEPLLHHAEHARGEQRQRVLDGLAAAEQQLLSALDISLSQETRAEYEAEAGRELEPFRARMSPEAYRDARRAVVRQRIRERFGLPEISA